MKKKSFLFILSLCLILPSLFLLSACTKTPPPDDPPAEPIKLNAPVVSLNDNIASWTSVDNAISYEVWIDSNTNTIAITITQYTLTDGQTFKVRAVGDGTSYSTSDWSDTVTYTEPVTPPPTEPTELSAPVVSINESGLASWNAVANASSYKYKINNGTEQSTTSTSVQLTDGDSIVVKAAGNGTEYTDSAYSESKTYTAPTPPAEPVELTTPVVSINSTGLATWNAVANASEYKYKINNGTEQSTTSTSVQLSNGDSIIVKAVGDGEEFLDSAYSSAVTYNANLTQLSAPTFTIDTSGQVVWQNVENATGYAYKINNGAEQIIGTTLIERCLQLSDGDSIMIKSLGDGVSYSDSNYSEIQTYTAPITPAVATYEYVCDLLAIKLQPIMQNSYQLGIVSDIEVERINAKNGMIYIHYHLGSPDRYALVQAEELAAATSFQDIVDNLEDYTYTIVEKITSFQSTEDALALVEAGMHWGVDSLDGYTMDDVSWATATTFSSASATNITVVLEDGTMVEYTLSVSGATASSTAKNDYINGCAHNILNETETTYQSLQDKLETVTYAEVVSAIEANLNAHIQASYSRGTVTNSNVIDISSDGTVYCTYQRGTVTYMATIQITGLENATTLNEAYTIVNLTTNYGTVDNKTQMQPTEDALALVQRGMVNGNISALNGYEIDDVSWVTATGFDSAKATDITVVFNDGKMVKYILTVSGAVSSTSAKNDYINGCAHNVSAGVVSEYQSLEDKLAVATYADVVSALQTKLTPIIQTAHVIGTVSEVSILRINAKDGEVVCTYKLGTTNRALSFTISEFITATPQNILQIIADKTIVKTDFTLLTFQPTEDALALVERGITNGNIDALDGYTKDDIVWATATTFNSAKATDITVVLEDGTMVKYTLSVGGASSSAAAKDAYINGAAHNILNETTSEYQSLQDKLNNVGKKVLYSTINKKVISNLSNHVADWRDDATNVTLLNISSNGQVYFTYVLGETRYMTSFIISGLGSATSMEDALNIVSNTNNYGNITTIGSRLYNIKQTSDIITMLLEKGTLNSIKTFTVDDIADITISKLTETSSNNYTTTITIFFKDNSILSVNLKLYESSNAESRFMAGTAYMWISDSSRGYTLRYELENLTQE